MNRTTVKQLPKKDKMHKIRRILRLDLLSEEDGMDSCPGTSILLTSLEPVSTGWYGLLNPT